MRVYVLVLFSIILSISSCTGFPGPEDSADRNLEAEASAPGASESEDSVTIASLSGISRSAEPGSLPNPLPRKLKSLPEPDEAIDEDSTGNWNEGDSGAGLAIPLLPEPVGMEGPFANLSKPLPGMEKESSPVSTASFDIPRLPEPSQPTRSEKVPFQPVKFTSSTIPLETDNSFSAGIYRPVSGITEEYDEGSSGSSPALEAPVEESVEKQAEKQIEEPAEEKSAPPPAQTTPDSVRNGISEDKAEAMLEEGGATESAPTHLQALPGEDLAISLPGDGWYYLGEDTATSGLRFLQRIFRDGNSIFLFSIEDTGEWLIKFLRQDLAKAISESRAYLLSSREEDAFPPLQGDTEKGIVRDDEEDDEEQEKGEAGKPNVALLYQEGEHRKALSGVMENLAENILPSGMAELLRLAPPGADDLPSSLHDASWVENFSTSAIPLNSQTETALVAFMEWFLPSISDDLRDRYYYRLAKMLETSPPPRDEKRAAGYYREIRDHYPWSPYWQEAGERERYLQRHYLEVR